MLSIVRTDSDNKDFQDLVRELDKYLSVVDGDEHSFYSQYNRIDAIKYVVVAYEDKMPVGCGAIKEYQRGVMEVKRMYVPEEWRGSGVASMVLNELEKWAKELGADRCVLETGERQNEAVGLYKKSGYKIIPNYGQYENVKNSICFEKILEAVI